MDKSEYTFWENKWKECYRKRSELYKQFESINNLMREIEDYALKPKTEVKYES